MSRPAAPLETLDAPSLCDRLDALAKELAGAPILAFDADGTLWRGDVTRDLISFAMGERPLREDALPRLAAIALEHDLPVAGEVHEQLGRLAVAYATGHLPETALVEGVLLGFAGHHGADFASFVEEAIVRANLPGRRHRVALRLLEWAEARGLPVVVVSASPRAAVERALAVLGIRAATVLGAEARLAEGRLLPALCSPVLVGAAKVVALRAHTERPVLAAFGDDVRDLDLLASSCLAVAIQPTDALRERLSEVGNAVVLAASDAAP